MVEPIVPEVADQLLNAYPADGVISIVYGTPGSSSIVLPLRILIELTFTLATPVPYEIVRVRVEFFIIHRIPCPVLRKVELDGEIVDVL